MSLAAWWHRVSMQWLTKYLDKFRKDPDITLDEYIEAKRLVDEYAADKPKEQA